MGLRHPEVREQLGEILRSHRGPPIRVQGQLAGGNALSLARHLDQSLGQRRRLSLGHQPALDTAVVGVDALRLVRGRLEGSTLVVASSGGFISDTVRVVVAAAKVDALLFETRDAGIDTARWRFVGDPRPETVPGAGQDGHSALLSNGDFNWPSGLLTREEFDLTAGLTLEVSALLRYTGEHWQEWELMITPPSRALIAEGERAPAGGLAFWIMQGPSPTRPSATTGCGTNPDGTPRVWTLEEARRGWHRTAIQIRPDNHVELYLDGELCATFRVPPAKRAQPAAVFVGGRSYKTEIYHGPILVTRGLRY